MTNAKDLNAKELLVRVNSGLRQRLIGMDRPIDELSQNIALWKGGKAAKNRPAGSFLLLGPRGIGKSSLAPAAAGVIHGNPDQMLKLDGSTFKGTSDMTRLIGAGPRYVGAEIEPIFAPARIGRLCGQFGLGIIRVDEVGRGCEEFQDLWLQILEEARVMNAFNVEVDFQSTVVFATSNDCAREIDEWVRRNPRPAQELPRDSAEFGEQLREAIDLLKKKEAGRGDEFQEAVFEAALRHMSDVFVDRFDVVHGVEPYTDTEVVGIIELMIRQQGEDLELKLQPSPAVILHILRRSYKPALGLRPVRRAIARMISKPLGMKMINEEFVSGQTINIDLALEIEFSIAESERAAIAIADEAGSRDTRVRRENRR